MPVHDVGYRAWQGTETPPQWRWWIISRTGVRLAAKSAWIRRILFAAWLPVLYWGIAFFVLDKAIDPQNMPAPSVVTTAEQLADGVSLEDIQDELAPRAVERMLRDRFEAFPQAESVIAAIDSRDPRLIRRETWRWLLMVFFRYPQALLIVFLVGSVAPVLISRDIRSRAFLLYFSRPIGRLEYILGKLMVPATFIMAVTTLPALVLYLFAVLMSPDFSVVLNTWDIPLRILVATLALVIPTSAIALMLSSLTQESRFASFAWFAVWVLGHGSYVAVLISAAIRMNEAPFDPLVLNSSMAQSWSVLSLYNCLGDVQTLIFGFARFSDVWHSALVLLGVTVFSLVVLYRRVSSPLRI